MRNRITNKAFTLIELIVVIAIIAIIVLLSIPKLQDHKRKAVLTTIKNNIRQIEKSVELYYADYNKFPSVNEEKYTFVKIKELSENFINYKGENIIIDKELIEESEKDFFPIDYQELNKYIKKPDNSDRYVIESPNGDVYYLDDLGKAKEIADNPGEGDEPIDDVRTYTPIVAKPASTPVNKQMALVKFDGSSADSLNSIIKTEEGYFVAGYTGSSNFGFTPQNWDGIIAKFDETFNLSWIKNIGTTGNDKMTSITQTNDGNLVVAGYIVSSITGVTSLGSSDAIVSKYDVEGNQLWVKNFGGANVDIFNFVKSTNDGGVIAVGYTESSTEDFTNTGRKDAYIVKIDSNGNKQWSKTFGTTQDDIFNSVVQLNDGTFVVVGESGYSDYSTENGIIIRFDANGNILWNVNIPKISNFKSIIATEDNNLMVVGRSTVSFDGITNKGSGDAIIGKYDIDGNQLWIKNWGGSSNDYFTSVTEDESGYLAIGRSDSSNAGFNKISTRALMAVKFDKNGDLKWLSNVDGNGVMDLFNVIKVDDSYVAVGDSSSTDMFATNQVHHGVIVKFDQLGFYEPTKTYIETTVSPDDFVFARNYGGSSQDKLNHSLPTPDGGYIAVGDSSSANGDFYGLGSVRAIISKYDKDGLLEWTNSTSGYTGYKYTSVAITNKGEYIAVGNGGPVNSRNAGIIAKYDKDGNEIWLKTIDGSNDDYFNSITKLADGNFIVVGSSYSVAPFIDNKGGEDTIYAKFDSDGNLIWMKNFGGTAYEKFKSVISVSDGFVAVGYSSSSNIGFINNAGYEGIIVKFNNDGEVVWISAFAKNSSDEFESVIETVQGDFLVVGSSNSSDVNFKYYTSSNYNGIIAKYTKNGELIWYNGYSGSSQDKFYSITLTSDGGYLAAGSSNSTNAAHKSRTGNDAIIVKYDVNGRLEHVKTFGGTGNEEFKSIVRAKDGTYILVGNSTSSASYMTNKGGDDAIIVKYNSY